MDATIDWEGHVTYLQGKKSLISISQEAQPYLQHRYNTIIMYMFWEFPTTVEYQMIQTSWGEQTKCPTDYQGVLSFVYTYTKKP